MLLDNIKAIPVSDIIEKGARALINELGYTGYIKFMRIQNEIFKDMSIRDISDNAMKHWSENHK